MQSPGRHCTISASRSGASTFLRARLMSGMRALHCSWAHSPPATTLTTHCPWPFRPAFSRRSPKSACASAATFSRGLVRRGSPATLKSTVKGIIGFPIQAGIVSCVTSTSSMARRTHGKRSAIDSCRNYGASVSFRSSLGGGSPARFECCFISSFFFFFSPFCFVLFCFVCRRTGHLGSCPPVYQFIKRQFYIRAFDGSNHKSYNLSIDTLNTYGKLIAHAILTSADQLLQCSC